MKRKNIFTNGLAVAFLGMFFSVNFAQAGWDVSSVGGFGMPGGSISGIMSTILMWLLGMLGIFGIFGFLISGSMYLLASGDDDLIKRAKKAMTFSILGITVGLIGYIAFNMIYAVLNASGDF